MTLPSAAILGTAAATVETTTRDGRVLTLRHLHTIDKLRMFKAVGPELAQNPPYLGLAMVACSVTAIDGIPVPMPATESQVEALITRLGDCGMTAAAMALDPEPDDDQKRDDAGNSAGTPI